MGRAHEPPTSPTTISVAGPAFGAAHAGLHQGRFEALHGHTYTCRLDLVGTLDPEGVVTDFVPVRQALAEAIAPLQRRTLMPAHAPAPVRLHHEDGMFVIEDGHRRFALPVQDVVLLPVVNTSTELLGQYLLDQVRPHLDGVERAALVLRESPTAQARVEHHFGGQ
ncbi:6-carboxytetrahydropterin synthase [Nocardiopsis eucommiae]|uniref:6-carboxy-5,6,7,8-tetrahydropterin synthase n=1 Tax=Nocardiopsis eucommiae TaxID=2831970 RepID=A0A975LCD0_9ACTN|nr:6-carboxytetrahydropterin synthase [Nocardiopsis eucommiae]